MPSAASSMTASKVLRERCYRGQPGAPTGRGRPPSPRPPATSAITCWASMSRGATGTTTASRRPLRTEARRAAHSTSSSLVVGKMMPSGTPWREWLERPTRCKKVEMARGEPTWHASSTGPMSMPSRGRPLPPGRADPRPAIAIRSSCACRPTGCRDEPPPWSGPRSSPRRWAKRSEKPAGVHEHQGRAVVPHVGGDALDYLAQLLAGEDGGQLFPRAAPCLFATRGCARSRLCPPGAWCHRARRRGVTGRGRDGLGTDGSCRGGGGGG